MWPLLVALQLQIPAPVGYVNDFAGILRPEIAARMTRLIDSVRARSGGEIAVVTLKDLGGRPSLEAAVQIGRQWGVGARGGAGDPARNAGVVVLLKPGARPGDGRSEVAIATGLASRASSRTPKRAGSATRSDGPRSRPDGTTRGCSPAWSCWPKPIPGGCGQRGPRRCGRQPPRVGAHRPCS